jgi:flagellum-specific peptidoglycan hydrolase FlgJ
MATQSNIIRTNHIISINSGQFAIDLNALKNLFSKFTQQNALNLLIVGLLMYVFFTKDIQVLVNEKPEILTTKVKATAQKKRAGAEISKQVVLNTEEAPDNRLHDVRYNELAETNIPQLGIVEILPAKQVKSIPSSGKTAAANIFDNVNIFWNVEKAAPSVVKSKQEKCWDYISRYANVAKAEKQKFGIPVSITLAQGLLESNAGDSRLTRAANNHFGVKTFNKNIPHVVMKDDTPNDKFKTYNSAWESYRDHSLLLMRDHYKQLQYLSKTDYVGWARGLQKAGYATDKQYADKLIQLIEALRLYRFDEV